MRKLILTLVLVIILSGCGTKEEIQKETESDMEKENTFGVYLVESNEMIFGENDIATYYPFMYTFTFTPEGAKKMQSYQIDDELYEKEFVVKIGDEEIYQGAFQALLSSLEVIAEPDQNQLSVVRAGYHWGASRKIIERFEDIDKLISTDSFLDENDRLNMPNPDKQLQYLYTANGGLSGYYDNGTVAGCPRCDLTVRNLENMKRLAPSGEYVVQPDGSLLVNNEEILTPEYEHLGGMGWVMIDFEWLYTSSGLTNINNIIVYLGDETQEMEIKKESEHPPVEQWNK